MKNSNFRVFAIVALFLLAFNFSAQARRVVAARAAAVHSARTTAVQNARSTRAHYAAVRHNNMEFYRSSGRFYSMVGSNYVLISPPVGFIVADLPSGKAKFKFNNQKYYCYAGVIYRSVDLGYEVTAPKVGMLVPQLPEVDIKSITRDGVTLYQCGDVIYRPAPTKKEMMYEVLEV